MQKSNSVDLATAPRAVADCVECLKRLGIWYMLSRNEPAMSCADAAGKRYRLGYTGIPLWDELKSFLGESRDLSGNWQPFLAHCRGDRELDEKRLSVVLEAEVRRMSPEDAQALGVQYGTVNPFLRGGALLQLFDAELQTKFGVIDTVMTNAGEHTWAVEFHPNDLVGKLPHACWVSIIDPDTRSVDPTRFCPREPRRIGILTGNPPGSGLDLWRRINKQVMQLLGGNYRDNWSDPPVIIDSIPTIGLSLNLSTYEQQIREAIQRGIISLCAQGAKLIAHPAHSTHYFAPEMMALASKHGSRFVSMTDVTAQKIRVLRAKEVALLGIQSVTDFNSPYSPYREAFAGVTVHTSSVKGWKNIHNFAPLLAMSSASSSERSRWMQELLKEEVPASCKFVVLGMTEFTPIVEDMREEDKLGKIIIDPMHLYAQAIAREYLGM